MAEADHEESSPEASLKLISKLSCSLVGQEKRIRVVPNTQAHQIYGTMDIIEMFACNYGLNAAFEDHMRSKDLIVSGSDEDGTSRMVELRGIRFSSLHCLCLRSYHNRKSRILWSVRL